MFKTGNQLTIYKQAYLLTGSMLRYALFMVFALFYILAPFYVPAWPSNETPRTNYSTLHNQTASSSKLVFSSCHFPATGSNTVNFIKEDSKDDESRLFWMYFSGFSFLESCLDLVYAPIGDLIQSRHPVPLFVLYHSWKSFLLN